MEKQLVLVVRTSNGADYGYFSKWEFGRRVPGSFKPLEALQRNDAAYPNERLDEYDKPVLLQVLIKWSE